MLQSGIRRWHGSDRAALLRGLQLAVPQEGRTEDVRRAIVASWAEAESPAEVVKQLSRIDAAPLPLEMIRHTLKNGAMTTTAFGSRGRTWRLGRASSILQQSGSRRVRSVGRTIPSSCGPGLSSRGRATTLPARRQVLERLPATPCPRPSFCVSAPGSPRRRATRKSSGRLLAALVEHEPGDTAALDRLATLAGLDHDNAEMARLRSKKSEMLAARFVTRRCCMAIPSAMLPSSPASPRPSADRSRPGAGP